MKIEMQNNGVKFESVPIGGLFAYPAYSYSDKDVYMAVDEHLNQIDSDKINAVRLSDGYLYDFNDNDDVRLIDNAKLVIG